MLIFEVRTIIFVPFCTTLTYVQGHWVTKKCVCVCLLMVLCKRNYQKEVMLYYGVYGSFEHLMVCFLLFVLNVVGHI